MLTSFVHMRLLLLRRRLQKALQRKRQWRLRLTRWPPFVSAIMPGAVETEITSNSGVEMPSSASTQESRLPITSPEDAARIIIDGIEKDRLHIYVGKDSRILNLMSRAAPKRSTHLIQRQMKNLLSS